MHTQTLDDRASAVDSAMMARSNVVESPSAVEKLVKEQSSILFALHKDLCQHQRSVNQAFISLDQACCALVASVASHHFVGLSPQENSVSSTNKSACGSTSAAPTNTSPSSSSSARQFAQLLRHVEALQQFLFTNLYVHQRECALQLLNGVERFFLHASSDTSGHEELRSQVSQLRQRLSNAPPRSSIGAACDVLLPTSRSAPVASTSFPSSSSSWVLTDALGDSVDSARTQTSSASPPALPQPPRASLPSQQRLFALSSFFLSIGRDGPERLLAVLYAAQRRFRIHGIVLDRGGSMETSPIEEIQLAMRLGCLCLVIPYQCRRMYSLPSPIPIPTDSAVLAYDRRGDDHHTKTREPKEDDATYFTSPYTQPSAPCSSYSDDEGDLVSSGAEEQTSALESLFLSLEANLPRQTADLKSPWFPTTTLHSEATSPLVVQRAALKRKGRPLTHCLKRFRPNTYSNPESSTTACVGTTAVMQVPPDTSTETATPPTRPDKPVEDVLNSECGSLSVPHIEESQHIGFTQHGFPQLSIGSAVATATRYTPPSAVQPDTADGAPIVPSCPVFQISNSVKYLKSQLMEAIEQLGGVVDLSAGYSRDCRFLVVAEGITERTEKYLGACAAAAHIVPPRYVFDSQRRGYWLINRVHEYDMSPQRTVARSPRLPPIFHNWRVVLITCRSAAARGVRAALLAGGCTDVIAFVVDLTAEAPISASARTRVYDETCAIDGVVEGVCPTSILSPTALASATHILVECNNVTAQGYFQLPDWLPVCVRRAEYANRIFTLELLYFCLCSHPERIFDATGLLCDEEALTPACKVEPM